VSAYKSKRIQAKDVDEVPILRFLGSHGNTWKTHWMSARQDWSLPFAVPYVQAFPERVILAKLRALVERGLARGCGCGCRGDWHLTGDGLAMVALLEGPDLPMRGAP